MYRTSDGTWHASINLGIGLDGKRLRRHVQRPHSRRGPKQAGQSQASAPRCGRRPHRAAGADGGGVDQDLDRDRRADPQAIHGADVPHACQVLGPDPPGAPGQPDPGAHRGRLRRAGQPGGEPGFGAGRTSDLAVLLRRGGQEGQNRSEPGNGSPARAGGGERGRTAQHRRGQSDHGRRGRPSKRREMGPWRWASACDRARCSVCSGTTSTSRLELFGSGAPCNRASGDTGAQARSSVASARSVAPSASVAASLSGRRSPAKVPARMSLPVSLLSALRGAQVGAGRGTTGGGNAVASGAAKAGAPLRQRVDLRQPDRQADRPSPGLGGMEARARRRWRSRCPPA